MGYVEHRSDNNKCGFVGYQSKRDAWEDLDEVALQVSLGEKWFSLFKTVC